MKEGVCPFAFIVVLDTCIYCMKVECPIHQDVSSHTEMKMLVVIKKLFSYCNTSRNGRLRRLTLMNGHVMGAIPKGVVFILRPNLNSL